ncbi:MAG: DnaJ domain-containing protein [Steroidobacteraceae bacterium]|nr:DnaJ domain-containing protein [Steroidobacteraceae bacterium]
MDFKDYYKIMGVARDAKEAEIKQAYRKLARKYHPDVSKVKDAEARFKELGEAYEVLKNPEKRAAYDQLGSGHRAGEQWRPPPDWDAGFEFSGAGERTGQHADDRAYSEFFESLFGRAGRAGGRSGEPRGGEDHHAKVLLDLDATLAGGTRSIVLRVPEVDAEGRLLVKERTLNVQIPKGILPGQTIRLAGQGTRAPGGGAGDLYIEVEFQPHRLYQLDGRDLILELPLAPWEAVLGATVTTPTPGGPIELKIPPGSKAGAKLRVKGRGIPSSPPGDLYVLMQIALPPTADEKTRAAYRALAAAAPFDPRARLGV